MKSKGVYKKIIKEITIPPSSENFFKSNFDIANENFEQIYCIPFNATIYTKLRSFQFKINHNILYTNEKLHKVKISDTPLCTFCNSEIETLVHIYLLKLYSFSVSFTLISLISCTHTSILFLFHIILKSK